MNNHSAILDKAISKIIKRYPQCSKGKGNTILKEDFVCVLLDNGLPYGQNTDKMHVRLLFSQIEGQTSRYDDNVKISYEQHRFTKDGQTVWIATYLVTYSR